nr:flavodoxin [uncultured Clostridium sp.]
MIPFWGSDMPYVIRTFLEQYDLSEKTIVPFCTHGGGGFGRSIQTLTDLCPESDLSDRFETGGNYRSSQVGQTDQKNQSEESVQTKQTPNTPTPTPDTVKSNIPGSEPESQDKETENPAKTSNILIAYFTWAESKHSIMISRIIAGLFSAYGIYAFFIRQLGFSPHKNINGYRYYNKTDCEWIKYIKTLRNAGMSVDEVIKFAELYRQGEITSAVRRRMLANYHNQLADKMMELQKLLDSPV